MKRVCILGGVLLCSLTLSGCSNSNETEKKIDTISKNIGALDTQVDKLDELLSKKENIKSMKEEQNEANKKEGILDVTVRNEEFELTVTDIDFFEDDAFTSSFSDDGPGVVVIYYTMKNIGSENYTPAMQIFRYFKVTEESEDAETPLQWSSSFSRYEPLKELSENARKEIKPGGKIEAVTGYYILSKNNPIKIGVSADNDFSSGKVSSEASQSFSPEAISKAVEKNKNTGTD